MPSPLRFFKQDPNGKGRGRGIYYIRAHGYYSKYDHKKNSRDSKIKAKGWEKHKVGLPKASSFLHTGDGKRPKIKVRKK